MKCSCYASFLDKIANKTRFSIIKTLQKKPLSVSQISKETGIEQSNTSHHLKLLTTCNIVYVTRKGKQRIYHLNTATIKPILALIDKHVQTHECERICTQKK
ncbi:MAG: ArsR/SmtB family transcription factor [Candidatus Nanoarchaeia archaeon]